MANPDSNRFSLSTLFRDRWLLGIMLLAALLGLIYNNVILIGFGVDEPRHMNYVKLLFEEHSFPRLVAGAIADAAGHEAEYKNAHTYHPPLYYLILLPFYALLHNLPGDIEWHLLRGVSLLMCLGALPFIYQIAQRASGNSVWAPRLVVAQVALLPMWGMTAATIINDALVFFMVSVFLWLLAVRYPHERSLKSAVVIGIVFGLCVVSKANALPANAVALAVYLLTQYRGEVWKSAQAWQRLGIVILATAVIAGPWQLYNLAQYGSLTHTPPPMPSPALPAPSNGPLVMMLHDNFPQHFLQGNWGIFTTLWTQKDWIPENLRPFVSITFLVYSLIALVGLAANRWRKTAAQEAVVRAAAAEARAQEDAPALTEDESIESKKIALRTTGGAFLVSWQVVLLVALFVHWGWAEGGRYLFPVVIGLSILLACGWQRLVGETGLKFVLGLWIAGMLVLNSVAVYWLISYLNPTYGPGS